MRKLALGTSLMLLGLAPAVAAPTNVTGSYSLSYTSAGGNGPTLTPVLSQSFVQQLNLNTPTAATTFFQVSPAGSCGKINNHNCSTASGTVTVNFTFSKPTVASSSTTAAYLANYANTSDSISWNTPDPLVVSFLDGSVLDITLFNDLNGAYSCDWLLFPKIEFTLVNGPVKVPEAPTLAFMIVGVLGLAYLGLRKAKFSRA